MRCEDVREQLAAALRDELPSSAKHDWQRHLEACTACRDEVSELEACWATLGEISAEPPLVNAGHFERLLEAYRAGREDPHAVERTDRARERSSRFWRLSGIVQGVAVAAFLLIGILIGRFVHGGASASTSDLVGMRRELHDVRRMLTLSLLQQSSATERLRGVNDSTHLDQPGREVLNALLDALTHDSNVNVRLAAVDALRRFSDQAIVRERTVQTLTQTSSPMLQIALIDFLVETRDASAVNALQRLSVDPAVNESVRSRAEWGIRRLRS